MVSREFHRKIISRERWEIRCGGVGRGGDWWSDWAEAGGRTALAVATMPDCSRDFLFYLLTNEVVGDKDK